jgi:hypothetical protein
MRNTGKEQWPCTFHNMLFWHPSEHYTIFLSIQDSKAKLMVLGIDVYHDSKRKEPSVVGFVATTNDTLSRLQSIPLYTDFFVRFSQFLSDILCLWITLILTLKGPPSITPSITINKLFAFKWHLWNENGCDNWLGRINSWKIKLSWISLRRIEKVTSLPPLPPRYFSKAVKQRTVSDELSQAINPLMASALHHFKAVNGHLPEYIFVYRDGVGEGQLQVYIDKLRWALEILTTSTLPHYRIVALAKFKYWETWRSESHSLHRRNLSFAYDSFENWRQHKTFVKKC